LTSALLGEFAQAGLLNIAGSCCGSTPEHTRAIAAAVRGLKAISTDPVGRLQMDFDHAVTPLAHVSPWLAAHASEVQAASAPAADSPRAPALSIVVMAVGSRGDVQPFIPIARRLAERHRVRLATHREFRPMVEQAGLVDVSVSYVPWWSSSVEQLLSKVNGPFGKELRIVRATTPSAAARSSRARPRQAKAATRASGSATVKVAPG